MQTARVNMELDNVLHPTRMLKMINNERVFVPVGPCAPACAAAAIHQACGQQGQAGEAQKPRTTAGAAGHLQTAAAGECRWLGDLCLVVCGCGFVV